jgi:hypothetical protein
MRAEVLLLLAAGACIDCAGNRAPVDNLPTPSAPAPAPRVASPGFNLAGPKVAGCPVFPADNAWNRDVSRDPVDPNSERYLAAMNAQEENLHPDFGSSREYGIPWIVVSRGERRHKMQFKYDDESDPGPYPFPAHAPVEGGPDADGDRHVIAIDRDACKLYEGFNCWFEETAWSCESGAVFDLRSNKLRPRGWTSADAAGLPIFPGLVRKDEVDAGEIRHALRFTVRRTQRAHVHPATHHASPDSDPNLPPLGLRVRLKRDFDLGAYRGAPRVILTALQRYGMILADNGSDWFISGESNPTWNDDDLAAVKQVPATAFEVVKLGQIFR